MPGPYFEDNFNSPTITTGLNLRKTVTSSAGVTVLSGATATSGGNTTPGVVFASTTTAAGVGIYFGAGAPTITAPQGSLYLNTTGSSTSTRAYVNTTGSTTWTAITTAA
jgi:hypothetical protein